MICGWLVEVLNNSELLLYDDKVTVDRNAAKHFIESSIYSVSESLVFET
jgi:hypothetical protein